MTANRAAEVSAAEKYHIKICNHDEVDIRRMEEGLQSALAAGWIVGGRGFYATTPAGAQAAGIAWNGASYLFRMGLADDRYDAVIDAMREGRKGRPIDPEIQADALAAAHRAGHTQAHDEEPPAPPSAPSRPVSKPVKPARARPSAAVAATLSLPSQARQAVVAVPGRRPVKGWELALSPGAKVGAAATSVRRALSAARATLGAEFNVPRGRQCVGLVVKQGHRVRDWPVVLSLAAAALAELGALADA